MASSHSSTAFRFNLSSHTEGEIEGCAFVQFRLCPHSASVFVNDALHRDQAYARTYKLFRAVQPLEDSEQLVDVLHAEAHAVVSDHKDRLPIFRILFVTDLDDGRGAATAKLERVGQ